METALTGMKKWEVNRKGVAPTERREKRTNRAMGPNSGRRAREKRKYGAVQSACVLGPALVEGQPVGHTSLVKGNWGKDRGKWRGLRKGLPRQRSKGGALNFGTKNVEKGAYKGKSKTGGGSCKNSRAWVSTPNFQSP